MAGKTVKIIVTLGPATRTERDIQKIKTKGVDFVRINMSHSSIEDLRHFIALSKIVGIPFIIDTEGSQVRTGSVHGGAMYFKKNDELHIHKRELIGNRKEICLRPGVIIDQLKEGDLVYINFDNLVLKISDHSTAHEGYVTARVLRNGTAESNKAVVIDYKTPRKVNLPRLSEKDYKSIALGLEEGIEYVAASFIRSADAVDEIRKATKSSMKIISKIECVDALQNLGGIIEKSDMLLIDRGDLSKEIPIEEIPLAQKVILGKARDCGKDVFVASNLLETMIERKKPTRAEVHDVIATILDGAAGVTLSAETAIGRHPMRSINMMNKLLRQAELTGNLNIVRKTGEELATHLASSNLLKNNRIEKD